MSNNLSSLENSLVLHGAFEYYLGRNDLNVPTVIQSFIKLWNTLDIWLQLEIFQSLHSIGEDCNIITIPYIAEWGAFYEFIKLTESKK